MHPYRHPHHPDRLDRAIGWALDAILVAVIALVLWLVAPALDWDASYPDALVVAVGIDLIAFILRSHR